MWPQGFQVLLFLYRAQIPDSSNLKAFADNKINATEKLKFIFGRIVNIMGQRRKCWLLAFSPFPTMFSTHLEKFLAFPLTLSQTTDFRLFQTERVCRRQFSFLYKW